jgi:starch synthase
MTLSVLHIASEVTPFAKTGGLADACSALPRALARLGARVTLVMPRYRAIDPLRHALARRLVPLEVQVGARAETVTIYEGRLPGGLVSVYLVDHPVYDRDGIYGEGGSDYPDNAFRFALLGRAALELAHHLDAWPDLVHAHDWQGGPALAFARRGGWPRPAPVTVLTLHNLAFQGLAPRQAVEEIGLPWDVFTPDGAEFFGKLSLLKLGIAHADRLTTVSPRYAREICTPEHGGGLDGFLRQRQDRLVGIVNGIDTEVWDPARDPHLPVRYDAEDRTGKMACKSALQRELGLPVRAGVPLFGHVSRMTEQKGFTLIIEAAEELAKLDAQFVFLGQGERRFEAALEALALRLPARFVARTTYDEPLAHRIHAGADFFLMPSHFEPCGLNQMYCHRYGTIPIVRATGGLDDTVVDYDERTRTGTGFKFTEYTAAALVGSIKRAVAHYRHRDAAAALSSQIMRLDHSWQVSARRYLQVYEQAIASRLAA